MFIPLFVRLYAEDLTSSLFSVTLASTDDALIFSPVFHRVPKITPQAVFSLRPSQSELTAPGPLFSLKR